MAGAFTWSSISIALCVHYWLPYLDRGLCFLALHGAAPLHWSCCRHICVPIHHPAAFLGHKAMFIGFKLSTTKDSERDGLFYSLLNL